MLCGGASNEIWRLNLEQGKFLTSLNTSFSGVNVCSINPAHQLWGFGSDDGRLEFWNPNQKKCIARLDVASILNQEFVLKNSEITSLEFASDGLTFAVGK